MLVPHLVRLNHHLARFQIHLQQPESVSQYLQLDIPVMGSSQGMTQRETRVQCPRRLDLLGNGQIEGNGYRRDSLLFKDALDQSNGLITETSGWG